MSCSVTVAAGFSKVCILVNGGKVFFVSLSASSASGLFLRTPIASVKFFPPVRKYRFAPCSKGLSDTFKNGRNRFKGMYCGGRHDKTRPGKGKDIFFTFRQRGKVGLCKLHSGDNGVVVGYFLLFSTLASSGVKSMPVIKENFPQSSLIMPAAVSPMSSVR